jgi:hypothetical protein
MTELSAIIERLERAAGPDRELDGDIALAIDLVPAHHEREPKASSIYDGGHFHHVWSAERPNEYDQEGRGYTAPAYTASLDAAMTLAEGFGGQVTFFKDGTAKAFLWQPYPLAVEGKAASPAIALCIAALKAREATQP